MHSQSEQSRDEQAALAVFERERRRLFAVAYRMLGTVSEAEDVVQEAYLRWHGVEQATVINASAYLLRLVTRLCIDQLRAAHTRRTEYIGPWLPEPLLAERSARDEDDPALLHELADDLSTALLLLLERLSPVERAVFVLHESFGFSYREIGAIINKTEQNCRQIERRARQHLGQQPPAPVSAAEHDQLVTRFVHALRDGDAAGMVALLAEDATLYSDGGGKVQAARRPVMGAERIAHFLVGVMAKVPAEWQGRFEPINGRTGLLGLLQGQLFGVTTFEVRAGKIQQIFLVLNPDKLAALPGSISG